MDLNICLQGIQYLVMRLHAANSWGDCWKDSIRRKRRFSKQVILIGPCVSQLQSNNECYSITSTLCSMLNISLTLMQVSYFIFENWLKQIGNLRKKQLFLKYILLIMLLQPPLCPPLPGSPLSSSSPSLSSCPRVMPVSSLASSFPILSLTSPCLFCTYKICFLILAPFPPVSLFFL